jgi:hypothetical protein
MLRVAQQQLLLQVLGGQGPTGAAAGGVSPQWLPLVHGCDVGAAVTSGNHHAAAPKPAQDMFHESDKEYVGVMPAWPG